jgi:hypothetical protein
MRRTRDLIRICLGVLGLIATPVASHGQEAELDRTWRNAMVFAPAGNVAGYERLEIAALETSRGAKVASDRANSLRAWV